MTQEKLAISASAPGSIMLIGEHAVIHGHPAIVAAIEQRVTVTASSLDSRVIQIFSEIADPVELPLDGFELAGPMRFVLAALAAFRSGLKDGLRLDIKSQINPTLGLGSSAAITVAVLGLLGKITAPEHPALDTRRAELHAMALKIIRQLQRHGSGADLAASLYGGCLSYQLSADAADQALAGLPCPEPWVNRPAQTFVDRLPAPQQVSLCYSGYKTQTGDVLEQLAKRMRGREVDFVALYQRMGDCASAAILAAREARWESFAMEMKAYQALLQELGVSDATLDLLLQRASAHAGVLAAKISGSGLGDCIVALGAVPPQHEQIQISQSGLLIHD